MKKVIFLDRDGVINKDPGGWTDHSYVVKKEHFIFLPGSIEALKKLKKAGYEIIITSNQAGVSKGYYTKDDLVDITNSMTEELAKNGVTIKKIYYCFHQNSDNCDCRKPKTGLFEKAEKELGIKASGNYYVGDGKMDVLAGKKMNFKTVLVLSGKTTEEILKTWDIKPDYLFKDLLEAVNFITGKNE